MARAHGKVLLFGEHAVVFGHGAIAGGIDAGVSATVVGTARSRLRVPAWRIDVSRDDDSKPGRAYAALLESLKQHCADQGKCWEIVVDAILPAGVGLGSSAALAVACARAVAEHEGLSSDDRVIFDAAMASERVFHGNPSGLDHAAAMHGGVLWFVRGTPPTIVPIRVGAPLEIVVARVSAGADTGVMVAGVAARCAADPPRYTRVMDEIGAVTVNARTAVEAGDIDQIGDLMSRNHHLLVELGVSTPQLDSACRRAIEAGARGAKLTGAGGGGCIIAIVDNTVRSTVIDALGACSLETFEITLGAP